MSSLNTGAKTPYTFNSFSGVDIKAVFGSSVIGELQAISYSIQREKAPIYTMGSADPRAFSRGKRGIAGTLIFIMFDRHALLSAFGIFAASDDQVLWFLSDKDDVRPEALATDLSRQTPLTDTLSSASGDAASFNAASGVFEQNLTSVGSDQEVARPWFSDQIPPFDITLAAANEYGALATMRVYGVELLNEGYGVSIDDVVSEMQHTYIARTIVGWRNLSSVPLVKPASGG